jgi:hypothetical protein
VQSSILPRIPPLIAPVAGTIDKGPPFRKLAKEDTAHGLRLSKAKIYRERAEKLRQEAETMSWDNARDQMVHVANRWDFLAQRAEERAKMDPRT